MTRLQEKYEKEVVPALKQQFGYKNISEVPKLDKVVLSIGAGEAVANPKMMESVTDDLERITGQKASVRRAKKSIANFKLREGMPIGAAVTLRRARMYEFVDRFLSVALPRVRDFKGIPSTSFDGRGNYTVGLKEQIIFPEIDLDKTVIRGLNVTFTTTAKTNDEGRALLTSFGFPFRK